MPTYQYRCKICNYEFEEFQKITDEPLVMCPECQKKSLKRIIAGGAGLVFKGTGFYITDYKNENKSVTASSEKKPDVKSEKKQKEKEIKSNKKD